MRTRLVAALTSLLVLVAVALPGGQISQAARSPAAYKPNASITLATNADPNFNLWAPDAYVESDVIDPLIFSGVTKWAKNGQPQPDLARSWTVSKNRLVWTFNLRQGVRWQDGKPFTSADVVYTYNNIALSKKYPSNKASNFGSIKTVRPAGKYRVQFVLNTPWSALPAYLAWFAPILPKHIFKGQNPFTLTSFNKQHPIGTGPYKVTKYVAGQAITLTRNPRYFGKKPKIKTIIFQIIPQSTTQVSGLLSGSLDFIEVNDPQLLRPLQNNPTITLQKVPEQNYYYVSLKTTVAPFTDVRVRQALEYAIDKKAIIQAILKGNGQVSVGAIAPLQKYYYNPRVQQYTYNPSKALKLLARAGITKGAGGKLYWNGAPWTIDFTAGQYGYLVQLAELVQHYWQQLGITVNLKVIEWNSFIQQVVVKRQYSATDGWWIAPFDPDVYPYYACSTAQVGNNLSDYCNRTLDKLMVQGRVAVKPTARKKVYDQVQALMARQLPLLYLFFPIRFDAMSSALHVPAVDYNIAVDHVSDWYVSK